MGLTYASIEFRVVHTGEAFIARPRFTVIEAPSVLGLFPKGVEKLSDVLLSKGLGERLGHGTPGALNLPHMMSVATRKRCFSTRRALPSIQRY